MLFCIDGEVKIWSGEMSLNLKPGESVFVPYSACWYKYEGRGLLARAYN